MSRPATLLVVVSLLTVWSSREAAAQHFGRNKVEYVDFDFKVFETEHFAVYHYPSEEAGARIAARLAERWYARLSKLLDHKLAARQPLILYGSQPEFAQTNVVDGLLGEGIGGVTESARRRIVMPFAPTLAETDRILGHELTHAFQFEIARQYGGGMAWPLWAIEGLAQYLALGATDPEAVMWLRDAVRTDLLPPRQQEAARKFSPYRYGHAMWAYLAGRFGDRIVPEILKAKGSSALHKRIKTVTGVELDELYDDWRRTAVAVYGSLSHATPDGASSLEPNRAGRVNLGPSLSPDGCKIVFFSERDRLSLDLYLADTATGSVIRKLATTAAALRFESLQAIRSSGSWSPEGDQFVFAAVERGQPALVVLDIERAQAQREIRLPQFGQILSPSWSPDGRAIAFSALDGGITDLYVYDLERGQLRRLTNDPYSDLQPEWSPDGHRIAFVTDRFSSDLAALRFGQVELALMDVSSGSVHRLAAFDASRHANPQWSADGERLYFVSEPDGVSNVYSVDLESRRIRQVTDVPGGVAGLTPTSPALSAARSTRVLAFTSYRKGAYDIQVMRDVEAPVTTWAVPSTGTRAVSLPPVDRADDLVEQTLGDSRTGLPESDAFDARDYVPGLFLEAIGSPYLSSGRGPFGTFVRGGASLLYSDVLGERKLAVSAQAGNRLRDLAFRVAFINRERRWNWGAVADVEPSIRRLPQTLSTNVDGEPALTRESHYFERTQFRVGGLLAYPFNRAERLEFEAGARYTVFREQTSAVERSLTDGRVLGRTVTDGSGGAPATVGEAIVAYVHDTAVFGPTSPLLGSRSRVEVTSTFGELTTARLVLDLRRYLMPVRPYTVAMRIVHMGQYGPDANDPRLLPTFLGSRAFVRGYDWGSVRCLPVADNACGALEELLGRRLLVGNLEVRAPLMGMRARDLRYGPVPVEGFLFADTGVVWARSPTLDVLLPGHRRVSSVGAGARINAFGFPLELAAVYALDGPSRGWTFDLAFRSGF